jgi:hypothetical protein
MVEGEKNMHDPIIKKKTSAIDTNANEEMQ